MPKSFTHKFTETSNSENQDLFAEVFFSKREKTDLRNLHSLLNSKLKSPSETSLRLIREHSMHTGHLSRA